MPWLSNRHGRWLQTKSKRLNGIYTTSVIGFLLLFLLFFSALNDAWKHLLVLGFALEAIPIYWFNVIYRDKYQRMTSATWPAGPWPLINSPIIAAINPSIATLPLSRSTKPRDPLFQGRLVVRPSPNASKGSYWKFWLDKWCPSNRDWSYAKIMLFFIGLGQLQAWTYPWMLIV